MTATDTGPGSFTATDWSLMAFVAVTWGASFLFIDIGVDHLQPALVAWLRLLLGTATLAVVPTARAPLPRSAWLATGTLGVLWMAVPFVLFPLAELHIDSSLAGMINAAAPLFTAVVAAFVYRERPGTHQASGLLIGFLGVIAVVWPALRGAHGTVAGVGLALVATVLYAFAFNLAAPLEARHGALPVIWRAQIVAAVLLAPWGIAALPQSTFAWSSLLAVAALGVLGTAVAFVAFATLAGRVGPTRASVTVYFLPAVAITLGAAIRKESITPISLTGAALVGAGAYIISRGTQGKETDHDTRVVHLDRHRHAAGRPPSRHHRQCGSGTAPG